MYRNLLLGKMYHIVDFESRFVKIELIGRGSTAKVYMYLDTHTNTRVAVKEYTTKFNFSFTREMAVYSVLDSSFPSLKGYTVEPFRIVTELYDECIIRKRISSYEQLMDVYKQLLIQVDYLHSMGIAHRDIKSLNIVYKQNKISLIDFSSSRRMTRLPITDGATSEVTTVYWSAPELYENVEGEEWRYSHGIDIWSLGMTFIELLGIALPSVGETPSMRACYKQLKSFYDTYDKDFVYPDDCDDKLLESFDINSSEKVDSTMLEKMKELLREKLKTTSLYRKYLYYSLIKKKFTHEQAEDVITLISSMLMWNPDHRESARTVLHDRFGVHNPRQVVRSIIDSKIIDNYTDKYFYYADIIHNRMLESLSKTHVLEMKRDLNLYKQLRVIGRHHSLLPETMMCAARILDQLNECHKIEKITPWAVMYICQEYVETQIHSFGNFVTICWDGFTMEELKSEIHDVFTKIDFTLFSEYTPLDGLHQICNELKLDSGKMIKKLLKKSIEFRSPQSYLELALDSCTE